MVDFWGPCRGRTYGPLMKSQFPPGADLERSMIAWEGIVLEMEPFFRGHCRPVEAGHAGGGWAVDHLRDEPLFAAGPLLRFSLAYYSGFGSLLRFSYPTELLKSRTV